jgi:hypothetical protein
MAKELPYALQRGCIMRLHRDMFPRCREKVACMDAHVSLHHHDVTACVIVSSPKIL